MANAVTSCDLAALHTAITAAISAAYPALQTVEFYRAQNEGSERLTLPIPACLLEMVEADEFSNPDPGSEQQALMVRFEARFVVGFRVASAKLAVRELATAFAAFIRAQGRWKDANGVGIGGQGGACKVIGCYPDDFDPVLDQFEVWRVEWQQQLWFGNSVWSGEGVAPTTVFIGYAPDIGTGHEEDYKQVQP